MQRLYAHSLFRITRTLQDLTNLGEFTTENIIEFSATQGTEKDLQTLRDECVRCEFTSAVQQIDRIQEYIGKPTCSPTVFREYLEELQRRIEDEMEVRVFMAVDRIKADYFENPLLFGIEVAERLASANDDIVEAGTCLALGRGTACVMHLSRVVETGLRSIADTLDLPKRNDWANI